MRLQSGQYRFTKLQISIGRKAGRNAFSVKVAESKLHTKSIGRGAGRGWIGVHKQQMPTQDAVTIFQKIAKAEAIDGNFWGRCYACCGTVRITDFANGNKFLVLF